MPKLFVIPGHGAGDPGAGGFGYNEAERVRALATRMKALAPDYVVLGDFSRNYYADKGISNLIIPNDMCIIELHMDSSSSSSAKGGHVIIKGGYSPDQYDAALADKIGAMFPGRSNMIVGRNDLGNVNRAATRGFNYRLLEVCFISNQDDLNKFNSQLDEVAKAILTAFNIPIGDDDEVTPEQIQDIANKVWEKGLLNPTTNGWQTAGDMLAWSAVNSTAIKTEVLDNSDPTGRDSIATMRYRIAWMAKKQEDQTAKLEEIEDKLDALIEALTEKEQNND